MTTANNEFTDEAYKTAAEFDLYPIIPKGDFSIEFIENVFSFDPYYVLNILKEHIFYALLEKNNGKCEYALSEAEELYSKYEMSHKERILNMLIDEFRSNFGNTVFTHYSYSSLRITETVIFYYAFSIFYISRDIKNKSGIDFSKIVLNTLNIMRCEKSDNFYLPVKNSGKMFALPEFSRDKAVFEKLHNMIDKEKIS